MKTMNVSSDVFWDLTSCNIIVTWKSVKNIRDQGYVSHEIHNLGQVRPPETGAGATRVRRISRDSPEIGNRRARCCTRSWSSSGNSGKMVAGRQVWASSSGATMAITTEDEERYRLGQPQECRGRPGEKWALTEIGLGSKPNYDKQHWSRKERFSIFPFPGSFSPSLSD